MIKIDFRLDIARWVAALVWAVIICATMLFAQPAFAQSVQVTNSTDSATGGLNDSAASCAAPLSRTFSVGSNFTVADVNIGVLAAHTYRGDMVMDLRAPNGTTVRLTNGSGSVGADNFNVLFDDSAAANITTHTSADTAAATTAVPPYQRTFRSENALSVFNGLSSSGTWTLTICDQFGGDSGTFFQADLFLTGSGVQQADLSLVQSINTTAPLSGAEVTYTLTVSNSAASDATASSIQVRDVLPGGLIYRSQSGTGTYDSGTGIWTVGSLAVGASATIQISATNNTAPGTSRTNVAEIIASSLPDPDSGTNNGVTSEDDYDTTTFTTANYPSAGVPPTLSCPAGSTLFDWDAQTWTDGQLSRSFTIGTISANLTISGATNRLVNTTPARNTASTGGATGQNSLQLTANFANTSENVVGTWSFGSGVSGLQFTLADIDHFFGQFSDRVTVTGSYQGNAVPVTLTRGRTNSVSGNTVSAFANADNTTSLGNVIVTFSQNVDTVTIEYGSATGNAPSNPGNQAISYMDMTMCNLANIADLSLSKTLLTTNHIQNGTATYRLSLTNSASSSETATNVSVQDYLPSGFEFTSATSTSFDGNTGLWTVASLAPGQTTTVDISGTVTASSGATITNLAEVTASDQSDSDSVPNNGSTTEDDYDSVSFTVQGTRVAGVPPTLVCPNGVISFDWAGRSWPQGSTANNYTLTGLGAFNWSISSPAGFMNIASLGGQHPVLTTAAQNQTTLSKAIDFNNRTEFATTTITLGEAVDGAQFTIFDVDFAANDFADRVLVRGLYQGSTVIPVLTNGVSNYVIGNQAFGDQGSAVDSADGNVVATFSQPVDTIIIEYGNHSAAPADPDGQAIQMKGDISICTPDAQLTVVKTSSLLSDPVNGTTDPKAIPGALVRYCILVTNTGSASARLVSAEDVLPADVTYVAASIQSGATCGTASTAEDDDDIGGDETDPWGASFDTGTVTFLADEIEANSTAAVIFHATVN